MRYLGSRLKRLLGEKSGAYTELEKGMRKYRGLRKNGRKDGSFNLSPYLEDDHNITIKTLSALMKESGKPLDFFVELEDGETLSSLIPSEVKGNGNIVNSSVRNDLIPQIHFLQEKIGLQEQLLAEKERNIQQKDEEIRNLRKSFDKLIESLSSTK